MNRFLSVAIVLSLATSAYAQLQIKPEAPTPRPLIREAFMPGEKILLSYPMRMKSAGKMRWQWKYHQRKLSELEIRNVRGEKLSAEKIREQLSKPAKVLVSADGEPVHEYYLSVFKPDTLVIIDNADTGQATKVAEGE